MDKLATNYFMRGLADSTQKSYRSGQNRYLRFCGNASYTAVPASESVLCHFVSYLAHQNLKHKTIKVYLSAIRFLHIMEGAEDPFQPSRLRLQYVLRGIKRAEAQRSGSGKERLPISSNILRKIKAVWEGSASDPDTVMLWAACCLAFFGFLRAGEMTVPSDAAYDPSVHLNRSDIAVDNPSRPTVMRVTIKQSKTDPFRRGVNLFLGRTSSDLCPIVAMLNYLLVRGPQEGPLFKYKDGRYLTRQRFVVAVREALERAGLEQAKYCGHSFRIGAATTAAAKGMEDSLIKTLGRWRSLAYLDYIRLPRDQLANYSRVLCA